MLHPKVSPELLSLCSSAAAGRPPSPEPPSPGPPADPRPRPGTWQPHPARSSLATSSPAPGSGAAVCLSLRLPWDVLPGPWGAPGPPQPTWCCPAAMGRRVSSEQQRRRSAEESPSRGLGGSRLVPVLIYTTLGKTSSCISLNLQRPGCQITEGLICKSPYASAQT